jgi:hypothetical protein
MAVLAVRHTRCRGGGWTGRRAGRNFKVRGIALVILGLDNRVGRLVMAREPVNEHGRRGVDAGDRPGPDASLTGRGTDVEWDAPASAPGTLLDNLEAGLELVAVECALLPVVSDRDRTGRDR